MKKLEKKKLSNVLTCSPRNYRSPLVRWRLASEFADIVLVATCLDKEDEKNRKNTSIIQDKIKKRIYRNCVKEITKIVCEEHPEISTYEGIFGGRPHIKGVRISVTDILSEVVMSKSIDNVVDEYNNVITEEQTKEAIRYARDFLEFSFSVE